MGVRRLVAVVAFLAVVGCGCGKVNAGASPQGIAMTTTTTTTTSTTTIPNISVPDAVNTADTMGSATAVQQLTEAGFIPKVVYVTSSPACYGQNPQNDGTEWNAGAAISQTPAAGTSTSRGITVTLSLCAGSPSAATP